MFRRVLLQDRACQHVPVCKEGVGHSVHFQNRIVHQGLVPLVPGISSKHIPEGDVDVSGSHRCYDARFRDRVIKLPDDMK
eukprot:13703825-Ditylum_brightwellii.AAC.1